MKNTKAFLLIFTFFCSCNSYKEVPSIVGKKDFEMDVIEREAPYQRTNVKEGKAFTNLPKDLWRSNRSNSDWYIIIDKYKAEVEYGIDEVNGNSHIIRWLTKWPTDSINNINTPDKLYKYLGNNGFKDYRVIKEQTMDLGYTNDKAINVILLLYNGVKHEITLRPQTITVTSYLLEEKDYWESQGQFMLDTPIEVFEKYDNVNR